MKVRNGFVSNSSTSSFIVVGFEVEGKEWEELDRYDTGETTVIYEAYDNPIVGVKIAYWSDDCAPDVKLTQEEINNKFEEAKELAKKLGQSGVEPKLFSGTTCS